MRKLNVIGLNSGTSMDGIDAALFTIKTRESQQDVPPNSAPNLSIELVSSLLHPFDPVFQRRLQAIVAAPSISWEQVCLLNTALGEVFADAAGSLIRRSRGLVDHVDLIGSHGQTLWHAPAQKSFWGVRTSGTLQLGEPAIIAARTGITVVADFRTADMAMGGEGAPLVCFADEVIFGQSGTPTGVLNIGGIANITVLDSFGGAIMAFDTGPGNVLIDRATQKLCGSPFDLDGSIGRNGTVDTQWLSELMGNSYLHRIPPKTTGRELFGQNFADTLIDNAKERGLSDSDCVATLTAFTAQSVAAAYQDFVMPRLRIDRLVLAGGGADNSFLVHLLKMYLPSSIKMCRHEEFGISTKFKEALLFALLAYTTFFKIPNNVPACTGASRRVCLGKLISIPQNAPVGTERYFGPFRV